MSVKKLFEKNKKGNPINKYLKKSSATDIDAKIKSSGHLSESVKRENYFLPPIDYSRPENFVKYGSAKKYYEAAFDHIVDNYPYDGSGLEKTKFYNDLSPLEKYTIQHVYPKETGFVAFGSTYGNVAGVTDNTTGYYSSSIDFIQAKGGPHSGTLYSSGSNKTTNLTFGGTSGSTVEFLFQKNDLIPASNAQSNNQVIFDLVNGDGSSPDGGSIGGGVTGSTGYARMRIEVRHPDQDRFFVTMISGTTGFVTQSVPTTGGLAIASGSWHHYAFVFNTGLSNPTIDFYMDGVCHETSITASSYAGGNPGVVDNPSVGGAKSGSISQVTGTMIANLGALRAPVTGASNDMMPAEGWGKLSASLDEFRFWKKARTGKEIGRNWFSDVDGGADVDDIDFTLGLYYRFNEGTTSTGSIDKVYLDYAGRLSNGTHVGYSSTTSRRTGSGIDELELDDIFENASPVVRAGNSNFKNIKSNLSATGSQYDYTNTSYLMNTMPGWIYEEDERVSGELTNLNQIMGNYFDTLHAQISQLNKIKDVRYLSGTLTGSSNEFPHNDRLLENFGIEVPELFANATALERFFGRSDEKNFEQDLQNVKNTIYKNIYNNLSYIYKSKGNEKAFRNLIRCFGVDEDIISLNTYANEYSFELNSNYKQISSKKKYADFSGLVRATSSAATVYQYYDSNNTNSHGLISGSDGILSALGMTAEAEFIFPNREQLEFSDVTSSYFLSSSLFGWHTPTSATFATDTGLHAQTWADINPETAGISDKGYQVYAVKTASPYSVISDNNSKLKDVRFIVKDRLGNTLITSSVFQNVYDGQKWNLSLQLAPENYPFSGGVAGMTGPDSARYSLSLYGVNFDSGIKRSSFYEVASLSTLTGSDSLEHNKKFYLGAHRTNFTGTLLTNSDVRASSLRVWSSVLPTGTIDLHAQEVDSYGTLTPFRQAYEFASSSEGSYPDVFIPEIETLSLHWDFTNVTGSDSSGRFIVSDLSSGSSGSAVGVTPAVGGYEATYQGSLLSNVNLRQHPGQGEFFSNSYKPIIREFVQASQKQLPEYVASSDMVEVLAEDVKVFQPSMRPSNFYYSLEKSMYQSISRKMLELFASMDDFNNLIGEPVNSYRPNYKSMEKMREIFFRKIGNNPDLDKYVRYFKWIDSSVGEMIQQLFPASAKHSEELRTIIENHVLERNKYKYNYLGNRQEMMSLVDDGIESLAGGDLGYSQNSSSAQIIREERRQGLDKSVSLTSFSLTNQRAPQFRFLTPPLGGLQKDNTGYWKYTAEVGTTTLSSSVTDVNSAKTTIRNAARSEALRAKTVNISSFYEQEKTDNRSLIQRGSSPAKKNNIFNIKTDNFEALPDNEDLRKKVPNQKRKIPFRSNAFIGGDKSGDLLAPFSAYDLSGSEVVAGYITVLQAASSSLDLDITNFHQDIPGGYQDGVPLQGPFTKQHVGGLLGRNVPALRKNILAQNINRREVYSTIVTSQTSSFATIGLDPGISDPATELNGLTVTLTLGGVDYSATYNGAANGSATSKTVIGVADAFDADDATTNLVTSLNLAASADGLPIVATISLAGANVLTIFGTTVGPKDNGTQFAGTLFTAKAAAAPFAGGAEFGIQLATYTTGTVPKGHYTRNNMAKSPVNIANIQSSTGSLTAAGSSSRGIQTLGNFDQNYEVVHGFGRENANIDFIFNERFYTGSNPTAFLTTPGRRSPNRAEAIIAIGGTISDARKITLISTDGTSKSYEAKSSNDFANNEFARGGGNDDRALALLGAIEHSSGHNGKILVNIGGAGDSSLLLTQSVGGIPGNKKIVSELDNVTVSPFFTGGAPGLTGSADYAAPRQRDARRIGKSIIASRFSSPGSKEDSKQQFRDLATDQFSPNNALPFRNIPIRNVYNSQSMTFTGWGGFRNSDVIGILPNAPDSSSVVDIQNQGPTALTELNQGSGSFAAIHKTQRNQTTRFQILENYPVGSSSDAPYNPDANEYRTFHTASKRDNDFVQRPIPAADRIKWFTLLTGSNFTSNRNNAGGALTDQKDQWQLSGSRFPESITIIKTDYANSSSMGLHTKLLAATSANAGRKFQTITKVVPSIPGTRTSAIYSYDPWYERIQPPAPWTQTRVGNTNLGSFHRRNNLYELPPKKSPILDSMTRDPNKFKEIFSTTIRTDIDRGHPANYDFTPAITTRNIEFNHYKKFKEPPVTSRYKPLVHTIETTQGTPENINGEAVTLDIKYSYGNMLQGFANRDLNKELLGTRRHLLGKIKRPYDVILDYRRDEVDESISGINEIKSFIYQETVFPKEVHTYLSGTRSRLAFTNQDFWRDDTTTGSEDMNALINSAVFGAGNTGVVPAMIEGNTDQSTKRRNNRTDVRMISPFITSQGHKMVADSQVPSNETAASHANNFSYDGSGSVWPLDSFLYSDYTITVLTGGTTVFDAGNMRMGGNFMCTLPAGELMMPHFGRIFFDAKNFMTGTNTKSDIWTSSSVNSARYVYVTPCYFSRSNVGTVTDLQPVASATKDYTCSASYPGAPFLALPPWTAGTRRRFVDGVSKGQLAAEGHPFYDDYATWKKEIKAIAKDYAIVPEFRISENLEEYKTKGSVTGLISSSLELTGATDTVFDSTDNTFLERYSTSDVMEYLNPFMQEGSFDLKSNKSPRHLELKSDAVLKMLPYDGFYPVLRTLQLATLFSQSYGEYAIYGGESASHPARWRTLMQPFFAPGILYNSIKSGMAVSHPIRRDFGKKFPGYQDQAFLTGSKVVGTTGGDDKAAQPLAGCLSGAHGGNNRIPGNRRRREVGDFSNFDFSDADVAQFFWPDVIPFEGILKPMDHIGETRAGVVTSDINVFLRHFVTGTVAAVANQNDLLYRLAVSNFLGATPEFFLKKKPEGGFMTKIVAEMPQKNDPSSPKGSSAVSDTDPRTVFVNKDKAYMMEVVLKQTEEFNMYNNPCAFGIPTSTGSLDWGAGVAAATGTYSNGNVPPGRDWPKHRGEFAPFTAPCYYGPSVARFTYFPDSPLERYRLMRF